MNRQQQIDDFLLQAHRLAVARLRADPPRLAELVGTLSRWRMNAGATRSDPSLPSAATALGGASGSSTEPASTF